MGQYYIIASLDHKEYISTHPFGSGNKLTEFMSDPFGPLMGLAVLLADGNGRGSGDLRVFEKDEEGIEVEIDPPEVIGRWKGSRIVVAGDYADDNQYGVDREDNVYETAKKEWKDISPQVIEALAAGDFYFRTQFLESKIIDEDGKWIGPPYLRELANDQAG